MFYTFRKIFEALVLQCRTNLVGTNIIKFCCRPVIERLRRFCRYAICVFFYGSTALVALIALGLIIVEVLRSLSSQYDSSGRVTGPPRRPLPDYTQPSQAKDIHGIGGVRNRNPKERSHTHVLDRSATVIGT